ncbi:MAG: alpha/beta hydrolase, partial [Pseudomonadota bacterium]
VPTRMIHAHDDPWIPVESYQDLIGGFSEDTELHLCANGGHVGFHHAGATRAYHDRVLLDFLSALALRT